ncbi:MAG: alpha/beta hydrolase [Alphaproteobacteria bacterium]
MTLNPQAKALLDQMAAANAPKLFELPIAEARAGAVQMLQSLDQQGLPIGRTEDRMIPGPAGDIPARIYTPIAAGGAALPCLLFYHGGGFVIGNLDSHDALCRALANDAGVKVIAVDYRLAPEAKFPAAVEDAFAALKWTEANAMDLGIDPNRIAVGGDSAGGNLAAVVSILARDEGQTRITFQLLIYPWLDFLEASYSREAFASGYFLDEVTLAWFTHSYANSPDDYKDYRMSPLRAASHKHLPPAHIMTAGYDPLRDEGRAYAEKLRDAEVPVTYKEYSGLMHGFANMTAVIEEGRAAVKEAAAALKAGLGA